MRLIWLALEMKCMDEMGWISTNVFLGNAFSNKSNVVRNADNAILRAHFLVYFIVMHPIDTNRTLGLLIIQLSLPDKARDEVANIPVLRNKYIKYFLYVSTNVIRTLQDKLTSLVTPSLSQTTFRFFFVSSSDRLISKTSKNNSSVF